MGATQQHVCGRPWTLGPLAVPPEVATLEHLRRCSVIAHEALVAHPEVAIETLLTLGSPLGSPPFMTEGEWPGSTARWVNVVAITDPVALPGRVQDRFGSRVEERLIDNGHRGHHPEPYLNSRAVGEVIAATLAN